MAKSPKEAPAKRELEINGLIEAVSVPGQRLRSPIPEAQNGGIQLILT